MRVDRSVSWVSVAFALALGVISLAAHSEDGCTKDTDCKGDRVCSTEHQCVDPKGAATSGVRDWLALAQEASKAVLSAKQDWKRPEAAPVTTACATPLGMCQLPQAVPQGSSCGCMTPRGPVGGIAR